MVKMILMMASLRQGERIQSLMMTSFSISKDRKAMWCPWVKQHLVLIFKQLRNAKIKASA